ncbi:MAG TPA: hypothetical protein VHA33_05280 [Candidatus Angelobacter sp.]|jgi:hypothetical protein|nr:hypothetical protein [Candidatus Angelobacter sp.]
MPIRKEFLLKLAHAFEQMNFEATAARAVLERYENQGWQEMLSALLKDDKSRAANHQLFLPLYDK